MPRKLLLTGAAGQVARHMRPLLRARDEQLILTDRLPEKLRLAFLGDSITIGDGDAMARGWPSRLCEISQSNPENIQCYNLGVGGDTVSDLEARASSELSARFAGRNGRGTVVMIGVNDALRAAAEVERIPLELNVMKSQLTNILGEAQRYGAVLVVEMAPVLSDLESAGGVRGSVVLKHIEQINGSLKAVCESMNVPLVKLTKELQANPNFIKALEDGDGLHPCAEGHDLIARSINESPLWSIFLQAAAGDC